MAGGRDSSLGGTRGGGLCTEAPGHWTATDGQGRQKGPHSCQVPTTAHNVNELGEDAGAGDKTLASHKALWTPGPETAEGHRALGLIRGWGSVLLGLGGAQANPRNHWTLNSNRLWGLRLLRAAVGSPEKFHLFYAPTKPPR